MIDYVGRFYGFKNPSMQQLKENYEDKVAPFSAAGFYRLDGGKYGESRSVFVNPGGEKYLVDKIVIDEGIRVTSKTFVSSQRQDGTFTEAIMHQYSAPTVNELRYSGQTLTQDGITKEMCKNDAQSYFENACNCFELANIQRVANQFEASSHFVCTQTE